MAVSHVYSNAVADATGTMTVWFGATTATVAASDVVKPSDWNSAHNQFLTIGGNTAGQSTVSGTNIVFAGGDNITLSANGATVTVSGAAQTVQPVAASAANGSAAFSTLSFSNANGVSFSTAAGPAIVASHNGLTSQSNQAASASNGSFTFQTLNFSNANNVTFGTSAGGIVTASVAAPGGAGFSAGVSGGNTVGDTGATGTRVVFAGGNNITLSQVTDANGATITVSGANAGGAQTGISGIVVSNTTFTSGTVSFSNANGISFGSSASGANQVITASYTVPTLTNSSLTMQAGASTLSSVSRVAFVDSNGVSFGASTSNNGSITITATVRTDWLSTQSNQALSGSNGSFTFQTATFGNLNGLSFYTSNGSIVGSYTVPTQTAQTLGLYASSQTTAQSSSSTVDARSLTIVGQGNISVGLSNGSFIISQTGGAGANPAASASNGSFTFQTLGFSNANNVTFGTSAGSIITASVAAPGAAAEQNAINLLGVNTAGNTTATGSTIGLSGLNLTLSGTNDSQVVISAPATSSLVGFRGLLVSSNGSTISVGHDFESFYENMPVVPASTFFTMRQSTSHVVPFTLNDALSADFVRLFVSASVLASSTAATTGNSQFSYGLTRSHNFVIYSRGVGASSMSLQSVTSTQVTERQSINVSAAANSTQFSYSNRASLAMSTGTSGYTFDYSSSAASLNFHTSNMTGLTGAKMIEMPFGLTLAPGQYWLAYGQSSSTNSQFNSNGSRLFNDYSVYGASQINSGWGTWNSATNNSVHLRPGLGSFSTAGGGTTASLGLSNITTSGSHNQMLFHLARVA